MRQQGRRGARRLAGFAFMVLAACVTDRPAAAADPPPPPALVAVALDASGSLGEADIARSRELAGGLLERLPPGSEVAVFSFDDESRLIQARTSNADLVRRAVRGVKRTGRFTALHDALYDASRYLIGVPAARRALVLFTDGHDENSSLTLEDGLRVAQGAGIPVVAVGMGRAQERVLRRIAKLTGGDFLAARDASGPALAERVMAHGQSGAGVERAGGIPAARAPASQSRGTAPSTSAAGRPSPRLWPWLLLAVAAAAAFTALALRRSRGRHSGTGWPAAASPDATSKGDLSPTVVGRLDTTEEYLEKTVTLRERPVLAITRGPGAGELFELSLASAVSIGRARANDIVLPDVSISGQHCRVRPEDGGFVVHDLRSTNGTFVNDRRVTRHTLADGDLVQVGETVLEFRKEHLR